MVSQTRFLGVFWDVKCGFRSASFRGQTPEEEDFSRLDWRTLSVLYLFSRQF